MYDLYILAAIGALAHFVKRAIEHWGDKSHNWKKQIIYSVTYLLVAEAIIYSAADLSFFGYEINRLVALFIGYTSDSILRTVVDTLKRTFTSLRNKK